MYGSSLEVFPFGCSGCSGWIHSNNNTSHHPPISDPFRQNIHICFKAWPPFSGEHFYIFPGKNKLFWLFYSTHYYFQIRDLIFSNHRPQADGLDDVIATFSGSELFLRPRNPPPTGRGPTSGSSASSRTKGGLRTRI